MDLAPLLNGQWEFRVEHKGIRVFSARIAGSELHGFKGEITLQVSFRRLISLFYDMGNYRRWVHHLAEMEIVDKSEEMEYVLRQVIEVPWPLKAREVLMHSALLPSVDNMLAVGMESVPDYLPPNPRYHRVRQASGLWLFAPEADGRVTVIFLMYLDPGPDIPSALSNAGMFEVPFYTLNNLRSLVEDQAYTPPWPVELDSFIIIDDAPDTT